MRSSNIQKGVLAFEDNVYVNKSVKEKYLTKAGDILICARNGSAHLVGKSAYIDEKSSGLTFGAFMSVFRSKSGRLLYYFFNSAIFKAQTGLFSTSTINQLTADTLNNMFMAFPSTIEEEIAITNYLDEKTAHIDSLVENKLRLIELLKEERTAIINQAVTRGINRNAKLKPSGIDWLGDIPEYWEVNRLKWFFQLSRGFDLSSDKFLEGVVPVCGSNGRIGYHNQPTTKAPGITVGRSGSVGEVNFITEDFWAHNTCLFVYKNFGNDWKFVYHFLKTLDLKALSSGSVVGTLNRNYIHDSKVAFPPIEEQKQIVEFIETATSKIDATIATIKKEIGFLGEYRTALISEVVTGKIKVA